MAASWECPSLPMLSLPLKETTKTSFLALKPLIGAHYEENPDTFTEEIRQLDQLREHSTRPTKDYNGCSVLRRYFAQLHLLRARFPPETVGQIPVDFAWKDAYSGAEYIQEGFQIEQASLLYNIAALHAQLGSHGKRDTEQEMKEAITHFQCSAGALAYLDEHFAINHASKDLSTEFVSFYNSLMLGQAQECLVEKSLKGIGRVKNATISRLATRVAEFYSRCCTLLEGGVCNVVAKKYKDWPKLLKFKMLYYQAISHYYQGAHAEEMGKYGELIALMQLTVQKLNSITGKPPKGMGDAMKQSRQNFADHITSKLTVAKKQNEQVYHDTVPQVESVELLSGADLVRPVSFHPTDPKNLGTDIFSRLIPMRAHEVASIYSEEKAKLMRSVVSSVDEKDQELQQFMKSLNVTEVERIHEDSPDIPSNVLRMHQSLQGRVGEVRRLHASFQGLMDMSRSVKEDFAALEEMKEKEETGEERFQSQHGARPESQVCSGLWKEMDNYYKYNSQAGKSNVELKAMFNQHYPNLVLLSSPLPSLKASLPKMTLLDTPSEDASESDRWQHLLEEVEKMNKQRQVLMSRFRQQMSHDDITKNLVGHLGNDQEVFMEDHMRQFKELAAIIRQNLAAQDNILGALTEANAKKASTRQTVQEIAQQQQAMFAGLIKSGGLLSLLHTKIQEGIAFYQKLQTSVSRLRTRSEEVCGARHRERENIERQRRSMTPEPPTPPVPDPATSTNPPPFRPPKKPELAGNPLPAGDTPPPPPSVQAPSNSLPAAEDAAQRDVQPPTVQPGLEELQRIQMQQQAMLLGGLKSPPPTGPPQPGEPKQPGEPLDTRYLGSPPIGQSHPQQLTPTPPPQDLGPAPLCVPDAAQALSSLQNLMSLQHDNLAAPTSAKPLLSDTRNSVPNGGDIGVNSNGVSGPDQSQIPQRPPKPSHLKSGLLPSPFPSLPPTTSEQTSGLMELHTSQFPGGPTKDAGSPLQQLYPASGSSPSVPPEPSHTITSPGHLQPTESLQSPPSEVPTADFSALSAAQSANTADNGTMNVVVSSPYGTEAPSQPGTVFPTGAVSQQVSSRVEGVSSLVQPPMAVAPPYYQPNINIQPGEITVATSSIIGPIPSPLAVPSTTPTPLMHQMTTSTVHNAEISPVPSDMQQRQTPAPLEQSLSNTVAASASTTEQHLPTTTTTTAAASVPTVTGIPSTVGLQTAQPPADDNPVYGDTLTTSSSELRTGTDEERSLLPSSQPSISSTVAVGGDILLNSQSLAEVSNGPPVPDVVEHQPQSQFTSDVEPPTISSSAAPIQPLSVPDSPGAHPSAGSVQTSLTATTAAALHHIGALNTGVIPLPLTSLGSLTAPLQLETPTDSTAELMIESLAPRPAQQAAASVAQIQLLQQSVEEQKKTIEVHRREKESFTRQEAAYLQQIAQLQQQLQVVQQRQEQEKVMATDQQTALMQLLHQQQGMFSQQQSQMEKLSQQDETHRNEYLHVEEKFRETLRAEQEMKVSLQSQILQMTQENQKLNQTIQGQVQQMQALQLQLQQYSVHIQERDKQLVAFKDQHKQIVDKLEQRNQQRVAQLVQRIQELQLLLNQRRDAPGPPPLPRPLQPTVVPMNPQQNQDLGPAGVQPNLPRPLQPSHPHHGGQPPSRLPAPPSQQSSVPGLPEAAQKPIMSTQSPLPAGQVGFAEPKTPNSALMRNPSGTLYPQQSVQAQGHPQVATSGQVLPSSVSGGGGLPQQQHQQLRGMSLPPSVSVTSTTPPHHQLHQPGPMMRPASVQPHYSSPLSASHPSAMQPMQPNHHPQPGLSNIHGPVPTSLSGAHPSQGLPQRPVSHPPQQHQASFPINPSSIPQPHHPQQQQQQFPVPNIFRPPSDPSLQQMSPQQVFPRAVRPDVSLSGPPQVIPLQPSQLAGQRFPHVEGGPMMRPNIIPGTAPQSMQPHSPAGQPTYGPPGVHRPQFRGAAP